MVRTNASNYTNPNYAYATADTDAFDRLDVAGQGQALDLHDHTTGKGLPIPAGAIPNGTITSAMIADGTIVAGDIADGAITSAKILDGTIATADLANASVTNAKLAADTARANLLTNGGFEVWQRGNGPFSSSGVITTDMWQMATVGTMSVTRDTANADGGVGACAAIVWSGATDPTNRLVQSFHTTVENQGMLGRTVTLSARVKCSTANAVRLGANLYVSGNNWVYGSYHSGSGQYETLSLTMTLAANLAYFQPGLFASLAATAYLDNATLVVGSQAADYAPLHPADDLARCQRYYERVGISLWAGWAGAASEAIGGTFRWQVQKALTPTLTVVTGFTTTNCATPSTANPSQDSMQVYALSSGVGHTQFNGGVVAAEANP